jgi:drug/metabolite transporter (DMT)-like permease
VLIADNIGPAALMGTLFLAPLILTVACRVAVVILRQRRGERPWWGAVLGVLAILCGVAELVMFLATRGGVPTFFYLIAALPILAGLSCLVVWNKPPRV